MLKHHSTLTTLRWVCCFYSPSVVPLCAFGPCRCVEILARILNLSVAATKHVQPASPKTFRALKSRLKSDGDWLGLNRRLKNAAFALTGFLGDVVARCGAMASRCRRCRRCRVSQGSMPTNQKRYAFGQSSLVSEMFSGGLNRWTGKSVPPFGKSQKSAMKKKSFGDKTHLLFRSGCRSNPKPLRWGPVCQQPFAS